ncbi:hypothetical protein GQ53DRAFT_888401 [Thozetella sp. PMI_491]|nr:hypothetical protein GQ53DRAFT_888401 [Thozetella sp. PMI_491]
MRLLHTRNWEFEEYDEFNRPSYAVLASASDDRDNSDHSIPVRWAFDRKLQRRLPIYEKLAWACKIALDQGLTHIWVPDIRVDASPAAEEVVNASFRWLKESDVCLVYLDDLPQGGPRFEETVWKKCRYWKRVWMLQELIAPARVEFYDAEGEHRGSKTSTNLLPLLSNITGIPSRVLIDSDALRDCSLGLRISWAADLVSSRQEDVAYALVGITGVSLSVRYGEGAERAFLRLQEEILQDTRDGSIFGWCSSDGQTARGLLAKSPSEFGQFATHESWQHPWNFDGEVRFSSKGIQIHGSVIKNGHELVLDVGRTTWRADSNEAMGVYLYEWDGIHVRIQPDSIIHIPWTDHRRILHIARNIGQTSSIMIQGIINKNKAEEAERETIQTRDQQLKAEHLGALGSSDVKDSEASSVANSEGESSLSDSAADSDSASETDENEPLEPSEITLAPNHEYQKLRKGLVEFSYSRFRQWLPQARFVVPPETTLPPRKRYSRCLLKSDLQSITDVIKHLGQSHMQPPYCPTCRTAFQYAKERDDHARERTCELRKSPEIEGINERQKSRAIKRDDPHMSEVDRWLRLFDTIFPGSSPRGSPYLSDGIGMAVSMVREYWSDHGRRCISEYMSSLGRPDSRPLDDDRSLAALNSSALRDLVDKVFQCHQQD